MAKSLIINRYNNSNHWITVPADEVAADTFASTFLDGEYQVLKYDTSVGTDTETSYQEMQVMVKNATTKMKTYLTMKVKSNKTENEVFAALIGLTVNGIVVDECYLISHKIVTL